MDDAIHVQVQAVELRDERPVLKVLVNERVALRQPSIELGNSHGVGRLETPVAGVVQGPPPSDDTAGSAQDQWENVGRECQAGKPRGAGITQCNNTKTENVRHTSIPVLSVGAKHLRRARQQARTTHLASFASLLVQYRATETLRTSPAAVSFKVVRRHGLCKRVQRDHSIIAMHCMFSATVDI